MYINLTESELAHALNHGGISSIVSTDDFKVVAVLVNSHVTRSLGWPKDEVITFDIQLERITDELTTEMQIDGRRGSSDVSDQSGYKSHTGFRPVSVPAGGSPYGRAAGSPEAGMGTIEGQVQP